MFLLWARSTDWPIWRQLYRSCGCVFLIGYTLFILLFRTLILTSHTLRTKKLSVFYEMLFTICSSLLFLNLMSDPQLLVRKSDAVLKNGKEAGKCL